MEIIVWLVTFHLLEAKTYCFAGFGIVVSGAFASLDVGDISDCGTMEEASVILVF